MQIEVRVKKGNRKPEKTGDYLIVYTSVERQNNRANLDVIKQVALFYGVSAADISIRSGRTKSRKLLDVNLKD